MEEATDLLADAALKRQLLFMQLYKKTFPNAAKYIAKRGGSFEEAKDVFQDALIAYYEKINGNPEAVTTEPQAYIMGIVKHLWSRKFGDDIKQQRLMGGALLNAIDDDATQGPALHQITRLVASAGERCLQLLTAFYYDKLPAKNFRKLLVTTQNIRLPYKSISALRK
jgi:DNA-directed RNA polymerase specialized sigma24 family protein